MDYPTSFQIINCVIRNPENNQFLFGRKKEDNGKWSLLGGLIDAKDKSLEDASERKRLEEGGLNLECESPKYLFSIRIDDPRYRESDFKFITAAFLHDYTSGFAEAGGDINDGVIWFQDYVIRANYKDFVVEMYWPIIEKLIDLRIV